MMKKACFLIIMSMISLRLSAQWTSDTDLNTTVATSATEDIQSVGTSDGRTYIAFWHNVAAPQYYEMRLQLLDQYGVPQFGQEGMLVNNVVAMSSFITIWSVSIDQQNNVYIGFNGTGDGTQAYVHKIAPDGTQLWGNNGLQVGAGYDVKILPLSSGEAVVSWYPEGAGVFQKISSAGVPVWPAPVAIEPSVPNHQTDAGEMAELSGGDILVIYHDWTGFPQNSIPRAQRYDTNGNAVWAASVPLTNGVYLAFNHRYSLVQDGDVVYFGYSGATGLKFVSYLQRINPDGTLPWGINGSDFSTQSLNYEIDTRAAFSAGSDNVWAICQYTDPNQSMEGEYVQKFDKQTGARLLSEEAKVLYPISSANISHRGELQLVDNQPLFIVSDGNSNGVTPYDLLAVYLDENGDFAWPEQTRPVATNTTGAKSRIHFNRAYAGSATCAWTEDRPAIGQSRAYAQNIMAAECAPPVAGFTFDVQNDGGEVAFTSTAAGADTNIWDFGDGSTGEGANPVHFYPATGIYIACQFAINECGSDTICGSIDIIIESTDNQSNLYQLTLSPNPGRGDFAIKMTLPEAGNLSCTVYSTLGQVIGKCNMDLNSGAQVVPLDMKGAAPGTYFIHLSFEGKEFVLPVVVE